MTPTVCESTTPVLTTSAAWAHEVRKQAGSTTLRRLRHPRRARRPAPARAMVGNAPSCRPGKPCGQGVGGSTVSQRAGCSVVSRSVGCDGFVGVMGCV